MQTIESTVVDTRELLSLPTPKSKVSFDDLYHKARDIQSLCIDYNVSNVSYQNMGMDRDVGGLIYKPDNSPAFRHSGMTRYAMSQLCNKLGVPIRYLEKCIDNGMIELAAENVNAWLEDYNKNLFIREYNGKIRGVLSDRYMTLDTPEIMDVVADVVDSSNYSTKGYFLSPERFHARIVQNTMMNIAGEDLFAGIQIDSSDVGRSTLLVRFMIFKQVCTNGLCVSRGSGVLFEQRHIGISIDDFRSEFKESMSRIPVLMQSAMDFVEEARKPDDRHNISRFTESQMKDFVDRMKLKTKLSDDSVAKVIHMMQEKYSPTRWGLINSITEVAQDFTLERRVELEKIAGDMLFAA